MVQGLSKYFFLIFEERYYDILRINLQENDEMALFKDLAQEALGSSTVSKAGTISYFIMNLSNYKEK